MNLPVKSESDITVTRLKQSGWLQKKTCFGGITLRGMCCQSKVKGIPQKLIPLGWAKQSTLKVL